MWCFPSLCWVLVFIAATCSGRPNVLFLVSDDMRPNLGAYYGPDFPAPVFPRMLTPHLDGLAARSLLLLRAYCQQAICSPSRTSVLTGRRPDTTHVYDLVTYFRDVGGNFTTIPQYFKQNGYRSVGLGKIFHPGIKASRNDDPISWSEPYWHAPGDGYWFAHQPSWLAATKAQRSVMELPDIQLADKAIEILTRLAHAANSGEEPFFLALGFHKPHLPFVFPEEMLEYYPRESIRLPDNPQAPIDMPVPAWSDYGELRNYPDILKLNLSGAINSTIPSDLVIDLRRAYYSAITYVDGQVGRVLQQLKDLGLDNNTIVSFWGDHGWQLGEHGEWCKLTNFELSTHAPMMVHIPGLTDQGIQTRQLTEFVDLFPTLVDAAGLPALPLCPVNSSQVSACREGRSLLPLIIDPHTSHWKDRVFSQYPRRVNNTALMGYTMRTERFRYTEWVRFHYEPTYTPDWDFNMGVELYDHWADPEENWNHANDVHYHDMCGYMSKLLHAGWRQAAHFQ